MKKLTIIFLFVFNFLFSQERTFHARVVTFYQVDPITKKENIIDTLSNQIRIIKLNNEFINIGFSVNYDLIYLSYRISKKFEGHRMVGVSRIIRENPDYNYYFGYDDEFYPVVFLISKNKKNIILYYYYVIEDEMFYKSEILEVL